MDKAQIAKMIDHTILKPEATEKEILKLCKEAVEYNFASVCINPSMVSVAATALEGTDIDVCTVIGFPLGATTTEVKAFETKDVIEKGATEVDMVINVGKLVSYQKKLELILLRHQLDSQQVVQQQQTLN